MVRGWEKGKGGEKAWRHRPHAARTQGVVRVWCTGRRPLKAQAKGAVTRACIFDALWHSGDLLKHVDVNTPGLLVVEKKRKSCYNRQR